MKNLFVTVGRGPRVALGTMPDAEVDAAQSRKFLDLTANGVAPERIKFEQESAPENAAPAKRKGK